MFIQTETTPNPETLKFLPGRPVTGAAAPQDYKDVESLHVADRSSPLAEALFAVNGVKSVFFGVDFISITKQPALEWYVLKPAILGVIMEYFVTNQSVFGEVRVKQAEGAGAQPIYDAADETIVRQIEELLETRVRPAVAQDGGDIVFHGFEQGIVYLSMRGACSGCPSSTATLKMGIENMLRHYIPEVTEVRAAPQ